MASQIRNWCNHLAITCKDEFGYDGFSRNSFRKASKLNYFESFKFPFDKNTEYKDYLKNLSKK